MKTMAEERDPSEQEQPALDRTAPMEAVPDKPEPDETAPMGAVPDEPQPGEAGQVEPGSTAPMDAVPEAGSDRTVPFDAAAAPDDAGAPVESPRWSARAQVRPGGATPVRDAAPGDWEEVTDPYGGRSWFTPIILSAVALLLIAMLVIGLVLIYRATRPSTGPEPPVTASTSATPSPTQSARPSAVPTSAAPSRTAAAKVTVPGDVVGKSQAAARAELEALGLVVQVKNQQNPTAEPGTVLATNPKAGTPVDPGSTVVLVVATAPPPAPPPPTSASPTKT